MFNNDAYDVESETGRVETLIGHQVSVQGEMKSKGNITIDGSFKGDLTVGGKLTVGKEAHLEAEVSARDAFLAGKIDGNITVENRLELSDTAEINGDVTAGILVMAAGSVLNGTCKMGQIKQEDLFDKKKLEEEEEVDDEENDSE